jgi:hypothetical protein
VFSVTVEGRELLGLENIVAGAKLRGVAGPAVVEVVRIEWIGAMVG